MLIKTFGITDVGLKREENEDFFSTDDNLGLYVVADGMGGHLAGEVASRIAVELINKCVNGWTKTTTSQEDLFGLPDDSLSPDGNYVASSIRLANKVIYELATENQKYRGMGTTAAVLVVLPALVVTANVGDSRIYMVRDGNIERLSKDHTVVAEQVEMGIMTHAEAQSSPLRHVLTRNLGSSEEVYAEIFELEPANNDRYILCTDGLTDLVSDHEIFQMVENEDDPEALCKRFISTALERGGHDNTTVVSVFVDDVGKKPGRKIW